MPPPPLGSEPLELLEDEEVPPLLLELLPPELLLPLLEVLDALPLLLLELLLAAPPAPPAPSSAPAPPAPPPPPLQLFEYGT
jgi:hypothetical protein